MERPRYIDAPVSKRVKRGTKHRRRYYFVEKTDQEFWQLQRYSKAQDKSQNQSK